MDGQNMNNEQNNLYQNNTTATPDKKTDVLAIISLVAGILSIVLACCYPYVGVVLAIVGIVLAILSKNKNGKSGLGTAGLICSIIGAVVCVIMLILVIIGVSALSSAGIDLESLY